jgi:peroxiredoxin
VIVDTDQKLPAELGFTNAGGRPVSVADLRRGSRAVVLFFMRAASCGICVRHARNLGALGLAGRGVAAVVVVPGAVAEATRVRRAVGDGVEVVSSSDAQAHHAIGLARTLLIQHSGTVLVDADGYVRYRLGATLPLGSFDGPALLAAVDRL